MPIEPRSILETFFETGDIPTQEQFQDLLDSYVHQTDDGVTVYPIPGFPQIKYFGIGVDNPQSRLGVRSVDDPSKSAIALYELDALNANWYVSLSPEGHPGLSMDEFTALGNQSRIYIQQNTGNVGINSTTPSQKLEVKGSTSAGITGTRLFNTATLNNGVFLGHKQSSSQAENGAFSIYINAVTAANEFFTILPTGKAGIGISNPNTKLHVVTDVAFPQTDIDLIPGTGIMVIGPMTNNLGVDYRGIQARTGDDSQQLAGTLNLNRIAGAVLIHGDSANPDTEKIIFTEDGEIGVGVLVPEQKVDIAGALKIGTTSSESDGSIRFTGTDFEGFMDNDWVSLTAGMGPWKNGSLAGSIYYLDINGFASRVAIGKNTADTTLDILDNETVTTGNTAARIHNQSDTSSVLLDGHRVGLEIFNDGTWGGPDVSKNIALYISDVSGHTPVEANIGIVSNGNVLIGDLVSGQQAFGTGAQNTLAIRSSTAPGTTPDSSTIQIYSEMGPTGALFKVKLGDGNVISLSKGAALPPKNTNPVSNDYTSVEAGVLSDTRDRLDALEAFLKTLGLLPSP